MKRENLREWEISCGQTLIQLAILLEDAGRRGLKIIRARTYQISHGSLGEFLGINAKRCAIVFRRSNCAVFNSMTVFIGRLSHRGWVVAKAGFFTLTLWFSGSCNHRLDRTIGMRPPPLNQRPDHDCYHCHVHRQNSNAKLRRLADKLYEF